MHIYIYVCVCVCVCVYSKRTHEYIMAHTSKKIQNVDRRNCK